MIIATVTLELKFEKEINCCECQMQLASDCGEEWCNAKDRYLLEHIEDENRPFHGYLKRHYEGPRPDWCPLQKVEVRE